MRSHSGEDCAVVLLYAAIGPQAPMNPAEEVMP